MRKGNSGLWHGAKGVREEIPYLKYVIAVIVVRFPLRRVDELVCLDIVQMHVVARNP